MKSATTAAPPPETTWENPLIPNKRLRELYAAMAELRLLEERIATQQLRINLSRRLYIGPGEEACRVSTALSLVAGDLTSESAPGVATRFLRGSHLANITVDPGNFCQLPILRDTPLRLNISIGAAIALSSRKKGPLVLAYVHPGDLTLAEWKPILRLAATHVAPVLFVTLPDPTKNPGKLSLIATTSGVPGIPVDAADAVALYRVAQESMLRIRSGGGPVLMECIPFQLPGKESSPADPVLNMRESLLRRKLADDPWFTSVETRFAARLKAAAL